jgi:cytochrome P450
MSCVQTVAMLSSFILAIVTHPEVQVKGQREIDSVVGRERLPDFNDRPFLPYITAIVKEVLRCVYFLNLLRFRLYAFPRWNPVAPLGSSPFDTYC